MRSGNGFQKCAIYPTGKLFEVILSRWDNWDELASGYYVTYSFAPCRLLLVWTQKPVDND